MEGEQMRLMIDPNAEPKAHHTPIPVPLHWQSEVKAGLDQDVALGVLEPVPVGEPVTWCHRMVVCVKKNGKPRRTVDFQALNLHATRETHHTQSPFHQVRSTPSGKKKCVFDCWNGYHSVPLHEYDRHLTTFITPWGRYRYKTAPQGYIASGDGRFTHAAEARYAPVEGEALAVADALDKARFFTLGCENLIIAVDHKPLLKLFGDRSLDEISNARLRNLKEKTLRYRFRMTSPHLTSATTSSSINDELTSSASSALNAVAVTWDNVKLATTSDPAMHMLASIIESDFPDLRHELPRELHEYFQFRENLYTVDGIILDLQRSCSDPTATP
ncbi:Hypothetical predicted protein [Paramuricea clavata]|uniref:Reverse transcriptase RNase H-like domain-containing protein n=1 Tax=Paramuricea clavata TaxID=317549 RepID=A0A7D9EMQ8_PARCT|nr:Hypothetical predicted protein [Paramuricea clavata]